MVINGESIPTLGVFPTMMTVPDCVVIGSNKLGRGHGAQQQDPAAAIIDRGDGVNNGG